MAANTRGPGVNGAPLARANRYLTSLVRVVRGAGPTIPEGAGAHPSTYSHAAASMGFAGAHRTPQQRALSMNQILRRRNGPSRPFALRQPQNGSGNAEQRAHARHQPSGDLVGPVMPSTAGRSSRRSTRANSSPSRYKILPRTPTVAVTLPTQQTLTLRGHRSSPFAPYALGSGLVRNASARRFMMLARMAPRCVMV